MDQACTLWDVFPVLQVTGTGSDPVTQAMLVSKLFLFFLFALRKDGKALVSIDPE